MSVPFFNDGRKLMSNDSLETCFVIILWVKI